MEAPLLYPYAKEPTSTNTVIVEDAGDLSQGQGLPDVPSDQFLSFQNLPQAFPFSPAEPWTAPAASATADHMSNSTPVSLSMGPQSTGKRIGHIRDYQGSIRSLDSRWLDGLESQLPSNMTSPGSLSIPPDAAFFKEERHNHESSQYKSESSSVSGDFPSIYDPYSTANDEIPAFAERQLEDDGLWKNAQKDSSPPETSQPLQNATAFMVSEDPSESYFVPVSSRPRASSSAQRAPTRPQALALQSVATVRKRKQRNSSVHLDQNLPKPLQIVQEDGQGGSIASADFISPPRGARRKGPLSMVGRANAGLRRKNKDTCVQCRLNKRKVCARLTRIMYSGANRFASAMATPRVMLAVLRSMNSLAHAPALRTSSNMGRAIMFVCLSLPLLLVLVANLPSSTSHQPSYCGWNQTCPDGHSLRVRPQ